MKAEYIGGCVRTTCPGCGGTRSVFLFKEGVGELGSVMLEGRYVAVSGNAYPRAVYRLMKCGGCGRGALATIYFAGHVHEGELADYYPFAIDSARLPEKTPEDINKEFREAELCAAVEANRAASALFRSALEKTLIANGYDSGNLKARIDAAAADGLITEARKARAHEDVRTLGNDVLHDPWKEIDDTSVEVANRFTQRIIEDFYDDRPTAENLLRRKGRI